MARKTAGVKSAAAGVPPGSSLVFRRPGLLILALGGLVYAQTLFFQFNYLDDNQLILGNQAMLRRLSSVFSAFREDVFSSPEKFYYRPLLTVSFILDAQRGGASPFAYRLTNLGLHLAACCLLFRFLERFRIPRGWAAFLSMAFVVDPVTVQTVALISGRNDSLLAIFVLASFLFFVEYAETAKRAWCALHLVCWVAALFTKETAVAVPLLCGLYLGWIRRESWLLPRPRPLIFVWAALGSAWFVLRSRVLDNPHGFTLPEMLSASVRQSPVLLSYLGKIVLPVDLPIFPVLSEMRLSCGFAALTLGAALLAASKREDRPLVAFGAAWYLLFLFPPLLLPAGQGSQNAFMNHRAYVPAFGIVLAFGILLARAASPWARRTRAGLGIALLAVFSALTIIRSRDYKDRLVFWKSAVRSSPGSAFAHNNLGAMYFLDRREDLAEPEWRTAEILNPYERLVHGNLGLVDMDRGDLRRAEEEFKTELALNPLYDHARFNLGLLYYKEGKSDQAQALWKETVDINPGYSDAYVDLIASSLEKKDRAQAIRYARTMLARGLPIPPALSRALGSF